MTERKLFNMHHSDAPSNAVYIGRGSKWGNPWAIGLMTRDEVCDRYEELVEKQYKAFPGYRDSLANLHGKPLVCFCYPKRCHGETLLKYAAKAYEEREPLAFE